MRIARLAVALVSVGALLTGLSTPAVAAPSQSTRLAVSAHIDKVGVATVTVRWSNLPSLATVVVTVDGALALPIYTTGPSRGSDRVSYYASLQQVPKGDITFAATSGTATDSVTLTTSWTGWDYVP